MDLQCLHTASCLKRGVTRVQRCQNGGTLLCPFLQLLLWDPRSCSLPRNTHFTPPIRPQTVLCRLNRHILVSPRAKASNCAFTATWAARSPEAPHRRAGPRPLLWQQQGQQGTPMTSSAWRLTAKAVAIRTTAVQMAESSTDDCRLFKPLMFPAIGERLKTYRRELVDPH